MEILKKVEDDVEVEVFESLIRTYVVIQLLERQVVYMIWGSNALLRFLTWLHKVHLEDSPLVSLIVAALEILRRF
ncbi:hypothetical protein Q3G72_024469 [Acer saccharum]|nr:hypothetical protein Q3G72_024469 [Acer saccharum]